MRCVAGQLAAAASDKLTASDAINLLADASRVLQSRKLVSDRDAAWLLCRACDPSVSQQGWRVYAKLFAAVWDPRGAEHTEVIEGEVLDIMTGVLLSAEEQGGAAAEPGIACRLMQCLDWEFDWGAAAAAPNPGLRQQAMQQRLYTKLQSPAEWEQWVGMVGLAVLSSSRARMIPGVHATVVEMLGQLQLQRPSIPTTACTANSPRGTPALQCSSTGRQHLMRVDQPVMLYDRFLMQLVEHEEGAKKQQKAAEHTLAALDAQQQALQQQLAEVQRQRQAKAQQKQDAEEQLERLGEMLEELPPPASQ